MSRTRSKMIVALGILALAVPAGAVAKHGDSHGKAKGHAKQGKGPAKKRIVAYVFKGTYAGDSSVAVERGNSRVRKGGFIGETVAFDFSDARIVVDDTNADSTRNLDDVAVGDRVLVKSMLPKSDPGDQPFAAKRLIDQTNHPAS